MKVKICGITRREDALLAEKLGADIIGMIFAKSPRKVTAAKAKAISKILSPFTMKAGVFVDEASSNINKIVRECSLDIAQLHGNEDVRVLTKLKTQNSKLKIVKAVCVKDRKAVTDAVKKYGRYVDAFLFDTYDSKLKGGTGKTFNHDLLKGIKVPFFIAGGITPANVKKIVKEVKPFGVDVSSGVERSPGVKSKVKLRKLFEIIKKT